MGKVIQQREEKKEGEDETKGRPRHEEERGGL